MDIFEELGITPDPVDPTDQACKIAANTLSKFGPVLAAFYQSLHEAGFTHEASMHLLTSYMAIKFGGK